MKKKFLFRILFLFLLSTFLHAQGKNDFQLSLGLKYLNKYTNYGIDLNDSQAFAASFSLSHKSGFYIDTKYINPTETPIDAQQFGIDLGIEHEFSEIVSGYAEISSYSYPVDTLHLLSQYSNSISIGVDVDLYFFDLGFSVDQYLGGSGASYFSVNVSKFFIAGSFYLLPLAQTVFMSQDVDDKYLKKGKGKKKNGADLKTSLIGLSNSSISIVAIYPIFKTLSISVIPTFILNHRSEISVDSFQFLWNAGIRYKLKF